MKGLARIGWIFVIVLCICSFSYSQDEPDPIETSKHIDVNLDVEEVFGMQIYPEEHSQTLYPASANVDERLGELHMYVTTNRGYSWSIQAASSGMLVPGQTGYGVPLVITTFETDEFPLEGQTTADLGIDPLELGSWPRTIYKSGAGEKCAEGLLVHGLFHVKEEALPLPTGIYSGFIKLTMTGASVTRFGRGGPPGSK